MKHNVTAEYANLALDDVGESIKILGTNIGQTRKKKLKQLYTKLVR